VNNNLAQKVTAPGNQKPATPREQKSYLGQKTMRLGLRTNGVFQKVFRIG
jgi:hypothetical protein